MDEICPQTSITRTELGRITVYEAEFTREVTLTDSRSPVIRYSGMEQAIPLVSWGTELVDHLLEWENTCQRHEDSGTWANDAVFVGFQRPNNILNYIFRLCVLAMLRS